MDFCKHSKAIADKNAFEFEIVNPEDDSTLKNMITGSGQVCSTEHLDSAIEDARNNKNTMVSAMDSIISLMKVVECEEKAAEVAKEETARSSLDILAKVDELKQEQQRAKEANVKHARELCAQKSVLATEMKELQLRVSSLLDDGDRSLVVLDEMRRDLGLRLTSALTKKELAVKEKLEKEAFCREALAYQESQMEEVIEESKRLQQEATNVSKLQEFLTDRGHVVDMLNGEIFDICGEVNLLKKEFDQVKVAPSKNPAMTAAANKKKPDSDDESSEESSSDDEEPQKNMIKHARELCARKSVFATEMKELQLRVSSLLDDGDRSLVVLDEMRRDLGLRLTSALTEKELAVKETLEKEASCTEALAYQESQMEEVIEESKSLQQEAPNVSKALKLDGEPLLDRPVKLDLAKERGAYTPGSGKKRSFQEGGQAQGQTLFVRGLGADESFDNIRSTLEEHKISQISIPKDYEFVGSKGVAFTDFADPEEAKPRGNSREGSGRGVVRGFGGGRSGRRCRFGGRDGDRGGCYRIGRGPSR